MNITSVSSALELQKSLAGSNASEQSGADFEAMLNQAIESGDDSSLKETCDELETYMLSMLFKQVKKSMLSNDENSLIPKGDYVEMFESTMIDALAEKATQAGGIGLSDALYRQMKTSYASQMSVSEGVMQPASSIEDEI